LTDGTVLLLGWSIYWHVLQSFGEGAPPSMSTFRELVSFLSEDFPDPKVSVKSVVYIALFSLVPEIMAA
jgi:hypothetical protein